MKSGIGKRRCTVEEIVNVIADKPSVSQVVLFAGLMFFMSNCAISAYFPNFGGYLPYSDWKCLENSTECLQRTTNLTDSGWKDVSTGKSVYLNSRCSIKIDNIDKDGAKLTLMTLSEETTAEISFKISERKINVISNSSCPSNSTCHAEKGSVFDTKLTKRVCKIALKSGYDTTVSCNDSKIDSLKFGDVYGLLDASTTVRFVQFEGIGSYELNCPGPAKYDKDKMCGTKGKGQLIPDKDFYWYTKGRSTFSIDWELYCGGEVLRTLIGSVYFAGSMTGTFGGGTLYDIIGRKTGALVGYIMVIVSTFASAASPSVEFFIVCRYLQGAGTVLGFTGIFVLILEYSTSKHRSFVNSLFQFSWAVGYVLTTLLGYTIKSWHWLAAGTGILYCVSLIFLVLVPESPRYYHVNKKDKESAIKSLKWLKKLNKHDFDLDSVELTLTDTGEVDSTKNMGFMATILEFIHYREMTIQLVIQMWLWMVSGFLYYGFSFSWSKLGDNLYLSYLFASIGEVIAYLGMTVPIDYLGRKMSIAIFLFVASASFLFAMMPYSLGTVITVEQLSCLIGSMFVSAGFGSMFLFTLELAPTSHRGKIVGYCNFAARLGAFCGPQADLLFSWNKTGTLIIFTSLAALAGTSILRLPRTKDLTTPNTAEEVQQRREGRPKSIGFNIAKDSTIISNKVNYFKNSV